MLCCFKAQYEKLYRVGFPETLPAYLDDLDSRITRFDLPLGANVETLPCGEIVLQVRTAPPGCCIARVCRIKVLGLLMLWYATFLGPLPMVRR